jgi:uncharacterized protein (TIGR03435 family)
VAQTRPRRRDSSKSDKAGLSSPDPDLPSFATALREQLGLRLDRTRGLVDVLVIDSVVPPTED